jgi:hypothetical protein
MRQREYVLIHASGIYITLDYIFIEPLNLDLLLFIFSLVLLLFICDYSNFKKEVNLQKVI